MFGLSHPVAVAQRREQCRASAGRAQAPDGRLCLRRRDRGRYAVDCQRHGEVAGHPSGDGGVALHPSGRRLFRDIGHAAEIGLLPA